MSSSNKMIPGMVAQAFNPSIGKPRQVKLYKYKRGSMKRGSMYQVPVQLWLHMEILFQERKKNRKRRREKGEKDGGRERRRERRRKEGGRKREEQRMGGRELFVLEHLCVKPWAQGERLIDQRR